MIEALKKLIEQQERVIELLQKQVANREAVIAIYEGKKEEGE